MKVYIKGDLVAGRPSLSISVKKVQKAERAFYQEALRHLEKEITYPLGEETFRIDHGEDYFSFFDRFGELEFFIGLYDQEVVACAGASLRMMEDNDGSKREVWYLCDLKVSPRFRGTGFLEKVVAVALAECYERCQRAYGISMNEKGRRGSRITQLMSRRTRLPFEEGPLLKFFNLSEEEFIHVKPVIETHRGELGLLDLSDKKDIVIGTEEVSMPLLHIEHGAMMTKGEVTPMAKSIHMICSPEDDLLVGELEKCGMVVSAEATILYHNAEEIDWRNILTSEI